jgi:Ca-activated chloride channel family protein
MSDKICIKQMIVITDGCSNQGERPAVAALEAFKNGITVNAIGLMHNGLDEKAREEIESIAEAGGGIADFANLAELSYSMQALTRSSIQMTVETAIHRQLTSIIGPGGLASIPPETRGRIVNMWEEVCEGAMLKCLILLDCSGSMQPKLAQANRSIRELLVSLQSRRGQSLLAVAVFSGSYGEVCRIITDFSPDLSNVSGVLTGIRSGGVTPTGPAIREAMCLFAEKLDSKLHEYVV